MSLYKLLQRSVNVALTMQHENGSMPPGHNGPYHHLETPVRTTAHWLISFLKVYELTEEKKYRLAAERAVSYLLREENRPGKSTFWCLTHRKAHPSNGLIGQAWVIEALVKASEILAISRCYDLAEEVFFLHPWDEQRRFWHKVHINGRIDSFDYTFNHQLWFAAAASLLKNTPEAICRADTFTRNIDNNILLYRNGIIKHLNPYVFGKVIDIVKMPVKLMFFYGIQRKYYYLKAVGYHGFNLYALALLRETLPENPFWKSKTIGNIFLPLQTDSFIKELDLSKYAYPYNPAGIEIAFFFERFYPAYKKQIPEWLERQFSKTWDHEKQLLSRNVSDPMTSAARIYEATRLNNYEFTC